MMKIFTEHDAPPPSRETLQFVKSGNGFIPNLFGVLAASPTSLNGFANLVMTNDGGTLTPSERQVVQLAASVENGAGYCVAGHTLFSENIGLDASVVESLRAGEELKDPRYEALASLTRALIRKRGAVSENDLLEFFSEGFKPAQALEVIIGVALKTVTNYVSSAFDLPLDPAFEPKAWGGLDLTQDKFATLDEAAA